MNIEEEIKMLQKNQALLHNSLANLLNAYGVMSEMLFSKMASQHYAELVVPAEVPFPELDKDEYETIADECMNKSKSKQLKFLPSKKSLSYLG